VTKTIINDSIRNRFYDLVTRAPNFNVDAMRMGYMSRGDVCRLARKPYIVLPFHLYGFCKALLTSIHQSIASNRLNKEEARVFDLKEGPGQQGRYSVPEMKVKWGP